MINRYQSGAMERVFSDHNKYSAWRSVEAAHVRASLDDAAADEVLGVPIDVAAIRAIEMHTKHDVVAFVEYLQNRVSSRVASHVHRGLTSSDVVDTGLAMVVQEAIRELSEPYSDATRALALSAIRDIDLMVPGRTHGQYAEPLSASRRWRRYEESLVASWNMLDDAAYSLPGKMSGATGSYLLTSEQVESAALAEVQVPSEPCASQVVSRLYLSDVMYGIVRVGASLSSIATDIRLLSQADVGEMSVPMGEGQVGSSSMPHKKNPIACEKVNGLNRLLPGYLVGVLGGADLWLERDISNSSVERVAVEDAFSVLDHMLRTMANVIGEARYDRPAVWSNMADHDRELGSSARFKANLAAGMDPKTARSKAMEDT